METGKLADQFGLEKVSKARNVVRWMYGEILPFVKGDILEVGAGLGTYSQMLYRDFPGRLFLSDIDPIFVSRLRGLFDDKRVAVFRWNLEQDIEFQFKFDTVICLNVLEHIRDDLSALRRLGRLLRLNGVLVLLVPAHKFLYNSLDRTLKHYRRYAKSELKMKLEASGFSVRRLFYFNMFGIPGWYANGNLLKKQETNPAAYGIFDRLTLFFMRIERMLPRRLTGISLIAICTPFSEVS